MAIVTSTPDSVGTSPASDSTSWQQTLKTAVRCPAELLRRVGLPNSLIAGPAAETAHSQFRTFAPDPWIARIRHGDPDDPLLRQVLPVGEESVEQAGFVADAVGDGASTRVPGLIHKYTGRALLLVSAACAIHCRYCFRRHYPYETTPRSLAQFGQALQTVRNDQSIEEIILSGGDPLMMTDERLQELVRMIGDIPHIRRLRIHTRLPVVIPERVTDHLLQILGQSRLSPLLVLHCNHSQEIDESVAQAVRQLADAGIPLLNQSVLLRGINDNTEALVALSWRLVDVRCMPYYLHQLDRVSGAAHFEVPIPRGRELVTEMRNRLPGYAVPRYVCEIPGDPAKRILA